MRIHESVSPQSAEYITNTLHVQQLSNKPGTAAGIVEEQ